MEENYYPQLDWNDTATYNEKLRAVYNLMNWLLFEMSQGRVKTNNENLISDLAQAKEELNLPLSIAFVKMAEKGDIDEVTAKEHENLFLSWQVGVNYALNDIRTYNNVENEAVKLYKCLQPHTSQADWTPDATPSLWKEIGISSSGIPEWSQPIGAGDAYMTGDEVMYNGVHYRSTADNNVWSPEVYGWEVVA